MPSSKSEPKPKANQLIHQWSFEAIGTSWWIGAYQPVDTSLLTGLQQAITERIDTFDATYSRFSPDSLVTKIAKSPGTYQLPADATNLIDLYRRLYDVSEGKVTPLIGQALSDAGYDATYSLEPGVVHAPPHWDDVMTYNGAQLVTKQPLLLDFGAAGKGYLVDIVSEILRSSGIESFCVDAGGDMYCFGLADALRVGLESPTDTLQAIGVATLKGGALCGSAGNRRAWGGYHHILDPQKLTSPNHIQALWVTAESALIADGLATALFFVEPQVLAQHFSFEYLLLLADGSVQQSADFPAKLFILESSNDT